ncbi:MAG: hypothetical protein AB8B53_03600 [Flavobacteriales bacterium]
MKKALFTAAYILIFHSVFLAQELVTLPKAGSVYTSIENAQYTAQVWLDLFKKYW